MTAANPYTAAPITMWTRARINGRPPVSVEWRWTPRVPMAVELVFNPRRPTENPWAFARVTLAEGLTDRAGLGDVHLHCDGDDLVVALTAPCGSAEVRLSAQVADLFLAATYAEVPPMELVEEFLVGPALERWLLGALRGAAS